MAKQKNNTWEIEDWLLLFGGLWLLHKVFKTAKKAGIGALPEANRKLIPFVSQNGIPIFDNELKKLTNNEAGEIIRLIVEIRLKPELSEPNFKRIFGYEYLDSEFIKGQWRILAKQKPDGNFIMASFFKKKSNETPKRELEKANERIRSISTK